MSAGTCRRALEPLELELQVPGFEPPDVGTEPNLGHLEDQQEFLTTEPSLRPLLSLMIKAHSYRGGECEILQPLTNLTDRKPPECSGRYPVGPSLKLH